jgi:hypothetical protein
MKKFLPTGKVLLISLVLLSACGKENLNRDSIIGKWELNSNSIYSNGILGYNYNYEKGKSYISQFNSNNSYTLSYMDSVIETGTYKVDSTKVFIDCFQGNIESYGTQNFAILGNTLTLSNSGHDMAGEYTENWIYTRIR